MDAAEQLKHLLMSTIDVNKLPEVGAAPEGWYYEFTHLKEHRKVKENGSPNWQNPKWRGHVSIQHHPSKNEN